ncbi:MAG: DUF4296 domain-containing protein [Prevotellaceae bacterium]|jgi:hypothetical protein|nr:DUF4296 domain-containing protein [Prevotellaceae bacterium]
MKKIVFTIFILITFVSCSKQKIIPEKILADIIYQMQITDVVLLMYETSMRHIDSIRIYEPIVEKFGYSLDDLRNTFIKYTAEDGKLQDVFKQVIAKINNEKNIYQEPARIEKLSENMNVGADSIFIYARTMSKQNIEVRLSEQGVYDVSASYFFYKNDSAVNPRMTIWLESRMHKDSIIEKQEVSLVKDTVFTDYSLRVRFNNLDFNILKIFWLDFDNKLEAPKLVTSPSKTPANKQIINSKKKPAAKIKPDTITRQHLIIKRKSVKYNFEESDTTRLKEKNEFVGPPSPFEFLDTKDSVSNAIDTLERIIAIKRKDSISYN